MSTQHPVRASSCGGILRTVVGSHHLWKISIPISHVPGTLHPQYRHQSPILSFHQAVSLRMIHRRKSLSYLRTTHVLLVEFS